VTELANRKAGLEARLAELHSRADRIEADLREPLSADSGEAATETEDDESLEGQDRLAHHEIRMINAAIARITDGSYGACTRCGEDIAPARLDAMPEAPLCIACARAFAG
jgi:DnaK suppressor protein